MGKGFLFLRQRLRKTSQAHHFPALVQLHDWPEEPQEEEGDVEEADDPGPGGAVEDAAEVAGLEGQATHPAAGSARRSQVQGRGWQMLRGTCIKLR